MKEVLKEVDYKKILPMAEAIDNHGEVTPTEAKALCGKSEGNTNNTIYKKTLKKKFEK